MAEKFSNAAWDADDHRWMQLALALAVRGEGFVEPNPMVGCVLVKEGRYLGSGWHQKFGGPHAEVNAIGACTTSPAESTAYVTLEPCGHFGKTPPCAQALINAGIRRVVIAHPDPNPIVGGRGIEQLRGANIEVQVGLLQTKSAEILAPFLKRFHQSKPWVIAKWAMTLDGKIATASGSSQWISNTRSRQIAHRLRGRCDGILVGINTVLNDNPRLNCRIDPQRGGRASLDAVFCESSSHAKLAGLNQIQGLSELTNTLINKDLGSKSEPAEIPRVATRIVLDSQARLPLDSWLCQTAREIPTLVAVGPNAPPDRLSSLVESGCDVWNSSSSNRSESLSELLTELSRRGLTNLLVEGGGGVLGSLADLQQIDEIHIFVGGKLLGGSQAISPVGGLGVCSIEQAAEFALADVRQLDDDVYLISRRK